MAGRHDGLPHKQSGSRGAGEGAVTRKERDGGSREASVAPVLPPPAPAPPGTASAPHSNWTFTP